MTAVNKTTARRERKREQVIGFELTPALIAFRRTAGDANRHLNTLLVALETLKSTDPIKPPTLAVPWTKPGVKKEWDDSRDFVLKGCMIAVVDALDQYMRVVARIPGLAALELDDVLNGRRGAGQSRRPTVAERFEALSGYYANVIPPEYVAALHLLVTWRNQFVHNDYRFGLTLALRKTLTAAAASFASDFQNTDIVAALDRFSRRQPPELGDLAALIAVTQRVVRRIDEHLLQLQSGNAYASSLMHYLVEAQEDRDAFIDATWKHGGDQSAGRVHALFLDNGGNHDHNRLANAPGITRGELNGLFAYGRNRAREVFAHVPKV